MPVLFVVALLAAIVSPLPPDASRSPFPASEHPRSAVQPFDDSMWVKLDSVSIGSPPSSFWRGLCLDPNGTDVWTSGGDNAPRIQKRNRFTGALVDSFTGQGTGPYDLVRLGDSLCVANFSTNAFYIYDTLGNFIRSFGFPPGSLRGVDWDGAQFWASARTEPYCIYTLDPSGTVKKTLTPTGSPVPASMGVITLDRVYANRIWVSDGQNGTDNVWYCAFDTTADTYSILATFSLPTSGYPGGLAFDGPDSAGSYIWALGRSNTWLWRLKVHEPTITHDVGAGVVLAPVDTVDTGALVTPVAVVRNFGTSEETFLTRLTIGTGYTDTTTVTLGPGVADTLAFADWEADSVGTFAVRCTTELAGDADPANDVATDSVIVYPFTGIEEERSLPIAFSLGRVLPNPTGGRATIRFGLPRASRVSINLYSSSGSFVQTLCKGELPAGHHSVNCELKTEDSRLIAAGVYLLRLEAGAFTSTRKLIVQR